MNVIVFPPEPVQHLFLKHIKPIQLNIFGIFERPMKAYSYFSHLEAKELNRTQRTILFSILNRCRACPRQFKPLQLNIIDILGNLYKSMLTIRA